ncbi:MAG: MerR family transcriptional regulator [Pseudomonadota bacterium]
MSETILPPIPEKRYFTISEASDLCQVKPHVLRYWEQEFSQVQPTKRRGNRRYYQPKDVDLLRLIRSLLYDRGYTINGARQALKEQANLSTEPMPIPNKQAITTLREELEALLNKIK